MRIDGLCSNVNVNGNDHNVGDVSFVDDVTVLIVEMALATLEKVLLHIGYTVRIRAVALDVKTKNRVKKILAAKRK